MLLQGVAAGGPDDPSGSDSEQEDEEGKNHNPNPDLLQFMREDPRATQTWKVCSGSLALVSYNLQAAVQAACGFTRQDLSAAAASRYRYGPCCMQACCTGCRPGTELTRQRCHVAQCRMRLCMAFRSARWGEGLSLMHLSLLQLTLLWKMATWKL